MKTIRNQIYLLRFCLKETPGLFLFHVFACIEIEAFIFFEHTVWIGYNLDAAEREESFSRVVILTLGVFVFFIFHQLLDSIYFHWSFERMKPVLIQKLRSRIYEKAKEVDLACYDDTEYFNEFILSTAQADQCIERFLNDSQNALRFASQVIFQLGFLFALDKFGLLLGILCAILRYLSSRKYYQLVEELQLKKVVLEKEREYQHRVFYLHDYAKELRQNPKMGRLLEKNFERCNDRINELNRKYAMKLWMLGITKDYISVLFPLLVIYIPYLLYRNITLENLSLSAIVVLFDSVKKLIKRGGYLMELFPQFALNSTFVEKILDFLDLEPGIKSGEAQIEGPLETMRLSNVSFSYESKEKDSAKAILHNINMEIRKSQKIALVGYNGAGKTTLVKLLMRLYDPDNGQILRNGIDIRELNLEEYRKSIGAVFQDFKIYAATVRENVVMDLCTMDKQEIYEVEQALYRAKFSLFSKKLKYQIETPLTTEFEKEGVNLSGGESQKVAIARTLYRNHDLIIMDEPSSALDPSAEYQLNQELKRIAKDKTVVFISHRLSTAYDADWIYMMKDGEIVEQGTHQELLKIGGEYCNMWTMQAKAYQG